MSDGSRSTKSLMDEHQKNTKAILDDLTALADRAESEGNSHGAAIIRLVRVEMERVDLEWQTKVSELLEVNGKQ
jgi:hypothetical protein